MYAYALLLCGPGRQPKPPHPAEGVHKPLALKNFGLFDSLAILGKPQCLARIERALTRV